MTPAGQIIHCTAMVFEVSTAEIVGATRRQPVTLARQSAMWVMRSTTGWSLPLIGRHFHRDHTTVLHALNFVEAKLEKDREYADMLTTLVTTVAERQTSSARAAAIMKIADDIRDEVERQLMALAELDPATLIKLIPKLIEEAKK